MTTTGMLPVSTLIGSAVIRIGAEASIQQAAAKMAEEGIGLLVVGDNESLVGVLSERDIVRLVADGGDPATIKATEIATNKLVWCDLESPIMDIATEMMDRYVRHVLVEDDGELVGVVSSRDLIGIFTASEYDSA